MNQVDHGLLSNELSKANTKSRVWLTALILAGLLAGLPLAIWLDMRDLATTSLQLQAKDMDSIISGIRGFYSSDVVARVIANHGADIQARHDYDSVAGGIPLPATLSLALGKVISEKQSNISYRFVSDYPFRNRTPHELDAFEKTSLARLRKGAHEPQIEITADGLSSRVRMISPVIMGAACVSCHNSHPGSTKRDWLVGDVRGIQEVTVNEPIAFNLSSFKFILAYLVAAALSGLAFIALQRRQHIAIRRMNMALHESNDFLATVSMKISHYLSPQIYKSIFSGAIDVRIQTERKKLTIFFSDIKDFTELTEKLQPEEITALINEYFSEMSAIAHRHGGTIDKFIGDAILVFFGDPTSRGVVEDANACVRMAIDMQIRITELNVVWRQKGTEDIFRVRMGINTGYCNVGNFGSNERMDYTILGAEANLAARLQSIASAGSIIMSYETYALVSNMVSARRLAPTSMKGLSREVVPYEVEGLLTADGIPMTIFTEHTSGLDLYLNLERIDPNASGRLRDVLNKVIVALDKKQELMETSRQEMKMDQTKK